MGNKSKATLEKEAKKNQRSESPKQLRARARRMAAKGKQPPVEMIAKLYKPLEEWDEEELARGRPRAKDGSFAGKPPAWISRELHEEIVQRFATIVKTKMNEHTVEALNVVNWILTCDDTDDNGRLIIAPGIKLEAAKFLIEHVVGKPTQRVEGDISVKLQAILGQAIVMPDDPRYGGEDARALRAGSPGSVIDVEAVDDEEDDDE